MLKTLSIENIAVIEKADIEFSNGLNVLTGETGAGKSIVVDSINAILGERTSKELVRNGSDYAYVNAYFENINEEVMNKLNEYGLPCEDDDTLLLSRRISSQGKSVCRVNGCITTVSILKELGSLLVNIHGQHDSQALLNPDLHYKFVDSYGNINGILTKYKSTFKELLSVRKRLKTLANDADERDKQIEILDYQINELTEADIKVGEWEELKKRKNVVLNSQSIANAVNGLLSLINGSDDVSGIKDALLSTQGELSPLSDDEDIKLLLNKINNVDDLLEQIKDTANSKLETLDFSDDELDKIEERLNLLYTFSNKYGETEEDMLYYLDEAVKKRAAFDNSEEELQELNLKYDEAFNKTVELAERLSDERKKTAVRLCEDVCSQLEFLDMPKIKFTAQFSNGNLSSNGKDKIEFLISANPGEPPKPLSKIASGGELSRIMLAIKSILAKNDSIGTLIFDEIDTGVSGKASRKIGLKLKQTANDVQIICVTHSAQIASVADAHFLIEKNYTDNNTFTDVKLLDFEQRKYELARIMGGLDITQTMLQSAEELLNNGN